MPDFRRPQLLVSIIVVMVVISLAIGWLFYVSVGAD